MNKTQQIIASMETNLSRLQSRLPDLPVDGIMLNRLVLHLGREIAAALHQHIRPFGLAEPEFRVLTNLFAQPQGMAHPSDLCVGAAQSPASMSRICDALVERNLITRVSSEQDRRRMVLRVTEQGEQLVRDLLPTLFKPLRAICAEFSDEERQRLISLLKRLATIIEEVSAPSIERPA